MRQKITICVFFALLLGFFTLVMVLPKDEKASVMENRPLAKMPEVSFAELTDTVPAESSAVIREKVEAARQLSRERFKESGIENYSSKSNALMQTDEMRQFCALDDGCRTIMENVFEKINLSARAYDRILRVARTLADIEFVEKNSTPAKIDGIVGGRLKKQHITEAIQMRVLDRKYNL